jgi:hypothetical protein
MKAICLNCTLKRSPQTDEREWSITTGQTAARKPARGRAVARALQAHPIPAPPQS